MWLSVLTYPKSVGRRRKPCFPGCPFSDISIRGILIRYDKISRYAIVVFSRCCMNIGLCCMNIGLDTITELIKLNEKSLIATVGILIDIVGAYYITREAFIPFEGKSHIENKWDDSGNMPKETDEYKKWKAKYLEIGFILLVCGFFLQGCAVWR